jgi:hypothetical protein
MLGAAAWVRRTVGSGVAETGFRHADTARIRPKGVDAAFMSFYVHERGIHIV